MKKLLINIINEKPLKGNFDFKCLKDIHKYLFQDVYRWAGDIRNCNIAKQDLFCLTEHIESFGIDVFNKLKKEKYFVDYDNETTLDKYRSQRVFIESLAKINGIYLDLTNVSKMDMIVASHESINGDYKKLRDMFKNNNHDLSEEERLEYINIYCYDDLKKILEI